MHLAKYQRNAIFERLVEAGLGPRECELAVVADETHIHHRPTRSLFVLGGHAGDYTGSCVVGDNPMSQFAAHSWGSVSDRVKQWAEEVKHDVDTPDLWAELEHDREIIAGVQLEAGENTPFTQDERSEITDQLRQIKEYVKRTYSLSSEQTALLDARFDEIEAAAGRVGRKDWVLLFSGVILSVIVTGVLPPDGAQHVLAMALNGLRHLFGGWGGPPHLLA